MNKTITIKLTLTDNEPKIKIMTPLRDLETRNKLVEAACKLLDHVNDEVDDFYEILCIERDADEQCARDQTAQKRGFS